MDYLVLPTYYWPEEDTNHNLQGLLTNVKARTKKIAR